MAKLGDIVTVRCKHCFKNYKFTLVKAGMMRREFCSDNCAKRYWEKDNLWKIQDICPGCGGLKRQKSKRCKNCRKT